MRLSLYHVDIRIDSHGRHGYTIENFYNKISKIFLVLKEANLFLNNSSLDNLFFSLYTLRILKCVFSKSYYNCLAFKKGILNENFIIRPQHQ